MTEQHDHGAEKSPGPAQSDHGEHRRPGNQWWLMVACCAPMLLVAIVLVVMGALSPWILVGAIVMVAFVALTMSGTHGGDQRP